MSADEDTGQGGDAPVRNPDIAADRLRLTILGSGGSHGVPAAGNDWGRADPQNPKNHRQRTCIAVQTRTTNLLIDTGPDMRAQLNAAKIGVIDAVLWTHAHADHTHGLDDLRPFAMRRRCPVPVFANEQCLDELEGRFPYMFAASQWNPAGRFLAPQRIAPGQYRIGDIGFTAFAQDHFVCETMGYRFGPVAFSTDLKTLPEAGLEALAGVESWIVSVITRDHVAHADLDDVLGWRARIGARHTILTHLTNQIDHTALDASTPGDVEPAFDGMVVETWLQRASGIDLREEMTSAVDRTPSLA